MSVVGGPLDVAAESGEKDVEGEKRTTFSFLLAAMRAFEAAKARASVRSSSSSPSSLKRYGVVAGLAKEQGEFESSPMVVRENSEEDGDGLPGGDPVERKRAAAR